jgi:hypothetical protein
MQAVIAKALETVIIVVLSVSRMKAIEIAAMKTLMYRLALLRRNSVNSVRMTLWYLFAKIMIDANVRTIIMNV